MSAFDMLATTSPSAAVSLDRLTHEWGTRFLAAFQRITGVVLRAVVAEVWTWQ